MMKSKEMDRGRLEAIIGKYKDKSGALIPLLQEVQEAFGYVPPESIESIAEAMNLFPLSLIHISEPTRPY